MHYWDDQCPVPPSYVYLWVSLIGLVHWGGGRGHCEIWYVCCMYGTYCLSSFVSLSLLYVIYGLLLNYDSMTQCTSCTHFCRCVSKCARLPGNKKLWLINTTYLLRTFFMWREPRLPDKIETMTLCTLGVANFLFFTYVPFVGVFYALA